MQTCSFRISLVLTALLLSGCTLLGLGSEQEEPTVQISTTQATYRVGADATITVRVKNTSSASVYYSTCLPVRLQELEDGQITATLNFPRCKCICPAELKPGEHFTHGILLQWIAENKDQLHLDEERPYRLWLALYTDKGHDRLLDRALLTSNRFELVE